MQAEKHETVVNSYAECEALIGQYKAGKLELQPGCNLEQSLETLVTGKLNAIRETASQVKILYQYKAARVCSVPLTADHMTTI